LTLRDSEQVIVNVRDTEICRPAAADVPWSLLYTADADRDRVAAYAKLELTRVLRLRESRQIIGVYVLQQLSALHFQVHNFAVERQMQGQGFGRRLLGHALGLAESKGGRVVDMFVGNSTSKETQMRTLRILQRYGFVRAKDEAGCMRMRFELTPE